MTSQQQRIAWARDLRQAPFAHACRAAVNVAAAAVGQLPLPLTGELTYDTAELFVNDVNQYLQRSPVQALHIDCVDLDFCDTAGLSALLTARRLADAENVDLVLDHVPARLRRLLQLTGLEEHFHCA